MFRSLLFAALTFGAVSAQAYLFVSPSMLNFGSVPVFQTGFTQSVWVQNGGTTDVDVSVSDFCSGDFMTSSYACSRRLPAGGSCTMSATFRPMSEGYKFCQISLRGSDGSMASVHLSGFGVR